MRFFNGRQIVTLGVVLAVAGLLAISLVGPGTSIGQETDVGPGTDVGTGDQPPGSLPDDGSTAGTGPTTGGAAPPASLPDSGTGDVSSSTGLVPMLLLGGLAGLGIALAGAGLFVERYATRVRKD
ncbi:MAG: hypothetical protein U1B78_00450 [Dehalococcoidia bacterium]|nr:hypothetical protein [Dehalococcoidia bacterium]